MSKNKFYIIEMGIVLISLLIPLTLCLGLYFFFKSDVILVVGLVAVVILSYFICQKIYSFFITSLLESGKICGNLDKWEIVDYKMYGELFPDDELAKNRKYEYATDRQKNILTKICIDKMKEKYAEKMKRWEDRLKLAKDEITKEQQEIEGLLKEYKYI